ncbi:MAG: FAH family protein, partial [Pseudomonadota bacterium]|nr:FAH family protein [Pseudomonadota bacterium]
ARLAGELATGRRVDYAGLLGAGQVLAPLDHPEPARFLITGTGLTHTGSADARNKMHAATHGSGAPESDSLKIFRMGIEAGKPDRGKVGVQPEWFFKGTGQCVVAPGAVLPLPAFALAGAEEPEVVGLYIIDARGKPRRIGYCLGNEFSDHVTEAQNYLYTGHSKLRACSLGPELLIGELPQNVRGKSRVIRNGKTLWEDDFLSGEANMSHSVANLEHHHFKYDMFRRPGDLHGHFFGAAVLSYAAGIKTAPGDEFEISASAFGQPLRNRMGSTRDAGLRAVTQL